MVLTNYKITTNTIALLPVKHMSYNTIALENKAVFYINQPCLTIIKENCLLNGSSYEGRRAAIKYLTPYKKKLPIQINHHKHIYAFPTHATRHFECCWIFSNHVLTTAKNKDTLQSTIYFKNNTLLNLSVSHYVLNKQIARTAKLMHYFFT